MKLWISARRESEDPSATLGNTLIKLKRTRGAKEQERFFRDRHGPSNRATAPHSTGARGQPEPNTLVRSRCVPMVRTPLSYLVDGHAELASRLRCVMTGTIKMVMKVRKFAYQVFQEARAESFLISQESALPGFYVQKRDISTRKHKPLPMKFQALRVPRRRLPPSNTQDFE